MSLPLRNTAARPRLGDTIWTLARWYASKMNESEFATALREWRLPRDRYLSFIATMYPSVVGFNRALIRSIPKVDHVRRSGFVKALAEQLREEQAHNQLWRQKMEAYGLDHLAVYEAFESYLAQFSVEELDRMTLEVIEALGEDLGNHSPGCFPDAEFPEAVLALYHHLWMSASRDDVDYWEHYASQSAIEVIIFDVVSTSVYPGIVGNPTLDAGPVSHQWWREHARQGAAEPGMRSDEEKHLELAQLMLNRGEIPAMMERRVADRADETMRLFAATLLYHDRESVEFSTDRYRRQPRPSKTAP